MKPVRGDMIFEEISRDIKKNIFCAHPLPHNFWDEFMFEQLVENMRQKEDANFADILDRLRFGCSNKNDINEIKKRCVLHTNKLTDIRLAAEEYDKLIQNHPNLLCLFPTCELVDAFNKRLTEIRQIKTIAITAIDSNKFEYKCLNGTESNKRQKALKKNTLHPESKKFMKLQDLRTH